MSKLDALPARSSRLSPKLRRVFGLRMRRMLLISEACQQAGLSTAGWYKAMQQPAGGTIVTVRSGCSDGQ